MPVDASHNLRTDQTVLMQAVGRGAPGNGAPNVALISGSEPNFTHEINNLLRDRLRLASLILFFGYFAFLVKGFVLPARGDLESYTLQLWILGFVTAIMGVVAWRLCVRCHYFLGHLRMVEWLIFGSSGLLFLEFGYSTLLYTAKEGYLVNVALPWLILLFTYALYVPNTWRRALLMMTPMALGPLVTLGLAWASSPEVAALIEGTTDFHFVFLESIMVMALATVIAVWGVRTIRSLRSEAFQAKRYGQYRLKRLLGRGGMGEVYLAEHVLLKRPCALKLIRPEMAGNPGTLARFEHEVQMTARLTHWNTIEIYDFGSTEDGTFFYVMEYLPGMSLDHILDMHGPLPSARIIHLLTQTCGALGEAHAQGMIHRDIKPGNIFAAKRGGVYDVAKLLDFGLVRSADAETDVRLTQAGMVTGSPLYMSPEQARGDVVDARSDIYALGCVAYALLTGRPPFDEKNPVKLLLAHAQQPVERPSLINAQMPTDLESVILRCLEKNPEDRFPDVNALSDALQECRDAGTWSREAATEWWQCHGCPKKKELDACISSGRELDLESESQLLSAEFATA